MPKLLSQEPLVGASPIQAIARGFAKTFQYSGRASRSEYWWFTGFYVATGTVCFVQELKSAPSAKLHDAHLKIWAETATDLGDSAQSNDDAQAKSEVEESPLPWNRSRNMAVESEAASTPTQSETSNKSLSRDFYPATIAVMGTISLSYVSLAIRRLHDLNLSGWWYLPTELITFNPFVYSKKSRPEGERFDKK